jgi:predicted PurR-regulated permease PerM
MKTSTNDLPRTVLSVLFLGLLIAGVFWVLRPFLAALIWGAMIVVATWPLRERLVRWLGGRRKLAVTALSVGLLLLFVLPLFFAVGALVNNADTIGAKVKEMLADGLPQAPAWLARAPLVGERAASAWNGIADSPLGELASRLTPYLTDVASWFAAQVGGLGRLLAQFLLTVVVAAVLWSSGEAWAAGLLRFARRLAGEQGEEVVILAGLAVRSVALGVGVTALVQSALAGIGLAIAGIPFAALLAVVSFLLCIAQLGPLLVLVPAVLWLFAQDATGWGIFLLVWSLVVGTMDNFLRPWLIRRGADLPLLLVFAGVLGGLMSFGLVGLFIGPVVLAVARALLGAWMSEAPPPAAAATAAAAQPAP